MKSSMNVIKTFGCIIISVMTCFQWAFAIDRNIVLTYPIIPATPQAINQNDYNLMPIVNNEINSFGQNNIRLSGSTVQLNIYALHSYNTSLHIQKAWILFESDQSLINLNEGVRTKNSDRTTPNLSIPQGSSGLIATWNGSRGENSNPVSKTVTINLIVSGTVNTGGGNVGVKRIQATKYSISSCGDGITDINEGEECDQGINNGTSDSAYQLGSKSLLCSKECRGGEMTGFLQIYQKELVTTPALNGFNPIPDGGSSTGSINSGQKEFIGGNCPIGKYQSSDDGFCYDKTPICNLSDASNFTGFDESKHIAGPELCTLKYNCNYSIINTGNTLQLGSLQAIQNNLCIQSGNINEFKTASNIQVNGVGNNRYFTWSCPNFKDPIQNTQTVSCRVNNGCTNYTTGSDCSVCMAGYFKDITDKCIQEKVGCKEPTATNYSGSANTGNINLCERKPSCGTFGGGNGTIFSGRLQNSIFQSGSIPNGWCEKGYRSNGIQYGAYTSQSQFGDITWSCKGTGVNQTIIGQTCSNNATCSNGFANFPSCNICPIGTEEFEGGCKKTCTATLNGISKIYAPFQTGLVYSTGKADSCINYSQQIICDGLDGNLKVSGGSNIGQTINYSSAYYTCETIPTCPNDQHFNNSGFCESNFAQGICLKNILQTNETKQPLLSVMKQGIYQTTYENGGYTNKFIYSGKVINGEWVRNATGGNSYYYDPSLSNYCSYGCNPNVASRDGSQCVLKVLGWYTCSNNIGWSPIDANITNHNNKLNLFDLDIESQSLSGLVSNIYNSFDFGVNDDNFATLKKSEVNLFITVNGTTNVLPQWYDAGGAPNDVCEFGCSEGYDWRGTNKGCCASSNTISCMQCISDTDCKNGYTCNQSTNQCDIGIGMNSSQTLRERVIRFVASPFITQTNAANESLASLLNDSIGDLTKPSRQVVQYAYDNGSNGILHNPIITIDIPFTYCASTQSDKIQFKGGSGISINSYKIISADGSELSDSNNDDFICPQLTNPLRKNIKAIIQLSGGLYPGAVGEIAIKLLQKYDISQPEQQTACSSIQGILTGGMIIESQQNIGTSCRTIAKFQEKCTQRMDQPHMSEIFAKTNDGIIQAGEECDTIGGNSIFPDSFKPLLSNGNNQVTCNSGRIDFALNNDRSHSCYSRPGACNEHAIPSLLPGEYAPLQRKLSQGIESTNCTGGFENTVKAGSAQCYFGVYYRNSTGIIDQFTLPCYNDSNLAPQLIKTWTGFSNGSIGGWTGFKIPDTWTGGEYKVVLTGINFDYCGLNPMSGYQNITFPESKEPICQFNMLILPPIVLHQGFRIGVYATSLTGFQTFFTNENIKPIDKAYDIFNNIIYKGSINELTDSFKNSSYKSREFISDNTTEIIPNDNPKTVENIKISTGDYLIKSNAGSLSGYIPTIITNGTVTFEGNNATPFDLKGIIYANKVSMSSNNIDIINDNLTETRHDGVPLKFRGILIAKGVQDIGGGRKNGIKQWFSYEDNKDKTNRFIDGSAQTRQIDLQYVLYSPTKLYRYLSQLLINKAK